MTRADIVRAYLKTIEDGGDPLAFLTDDAVQEEFPNALAPKGARRTMADLRAAQTRGRKALRSESYELIGFAESGDLVACEVLWRGVLAAPFRGLKPGDAIKGRLAVFFEFHGDRIRRQRNYDCFDPF